MDRTEALKVLGLEPAADRQMIEESYWGLVSGARGRRASSEIDRLNEAYAILAPAKRQRGRPWFPDGMLAWIGHESGRIRRRWRERNPEIVLILGATIALALFALVAGAGAAQVGIPLALVLLAAWSPWRRSDASADAGAHQDRRQKRVA